MARPMSALWLLERFESSGTREALIGDLVEEIAHGRSRLWVWQQVLALCGLAAVGRVRTCAPTPQVVTLALGVCVLAGVWIAPPVKVLSTWAVMYFVTGTLSLFGDLVSPRTIGSRAVVFPLHGDYRAIEGSSR